MSDRQTKYQKVIKNKTKIEAHIYIFFNNIKKNILVT